MTAGVVAVVALPESIKSINQSINQSINKSVLICIALKYTNGV